MASTYKDRRYTILEYDPAGKPAIDMDVVVQDMSAIGDHESELRQLGYEPLGEFVAKDMHLFAKEKDGTRLFNVHVNERDHPKLKDMVAVRDYLRSHPEEVKNYTDLKRRLFDKYPDDYGAYRKEKDMYMEELEKRALQDKSANQY